MTRELDVAAVVVLAVTFCVLLALAPAALAAAPSSERPSAQSVSGQSAATETAPNPCVGTITDEPHGTTLLSIQGARGGEKTVTMLVGIRPDGEVIGVYNGSARDRWWLYDVDPRPNGSLLLSSTEPGISVVERINATTGEQVAEHRFEDVLDSHDADRINGNELLMTDMSRDGEDRIFVYNLTREAVVWEYEFAAHPDEFARTGGGEYTEDWTHNNDVEQIEPGVFMVSVRNFDKVVAIDRETKEIRWALGGDENHDVLFEQHNPDYFEGANGTPTVLVADSMNDRVVEYARENGSWTRTWVLEGGGLEEPRDADRLPNGNTLVVDRRGHRLLEVNPRGEVVWEFYAPWQPYDAERIGTGDESAGPSARQLGATGVHQLTGSAGVNESSAEACYAYLTNWSGGSQLLPAEPESEPGPEPTDLNYSTDWGTATPTPSFQTGSVFDGVAVAFAVAVPLLVIRWSLRSR